MSNDFNQEMLIHREDVKKQQELVEALERLHDNPDFKKVILDGFLKEHALQIVEALAEPGTSQEILNDMQRDLMAQSVLKQYFRITQAKYYQARAALDRYDAENADDDSQEVGMVG